MRLILYLGKGGVGKTTTAAATAVRASRMGFRTLVVSTDVAHSLADALDQEVGAKPTQLSSHLWAQEVNVLDEVRQHWGELQGFVSTLLKRKGVSEVAAEAAETARRIQMLRELHRTAIADQLGRAAGTGHRVLEALYDRPIITVADVVKLTGTSYAAANNLVARLAVIGVLKEVTGYARNRRYRYEQYVSLFDEDVLVPDAAPSTGLNRSNSST